MKVAALDTAILEAKRFLVKAEEAKRRVQKVKCCCIPDQKQKYFFRWDGVSAASCKRSSLDLTRALACMRRSQ